ncbi:MAG: suppressor of fused domain protein, partial [Planctomycetota bacterium]
MDSDDPQGQTIRHEPRERGLEIATGNETTIEEVKALLERHVGPADSVFHEIVSDLVHLDVHIIDPSDKHPYFTLFTTGMSDRPMAVPEGAGAPLHAEIVSRVPADWVWLRDRKIEQDSPGYWVIRWMKTIARLPHEFESWIGPGHTVPNGDPPEPFAPDTQLCCMFLWPTPLFPEDNPTQLSDGRVVGFYEMLPIHRNEMAFKLQAGADELIKLFGAANVPLVIKPDRP